MKILSFGPSERGYFSNSIISEFSDSILTLLTDTAELHTLTIFKVGSFHYS